MRYALLFALAACGDHHAQPDAAEGGSDVGIDTPVDAAGPDADPNRPETLFGTGLCVDKACTQISPGISPYTPHYGLWSDGATKRRWISIPQGQTIDTTDMDYWVFPTGTKIWKEFTRDGVRVETRYITKIGTGNTFADWFYVSYQWNATNDDTMAVPAGVKNANGTQHDIPSRQDCINCHENLTPSRILGFGAIQLDVHAAVGELDLDGVIAKGWIPALPGTTPRFPLPSSTGKEPPALGYMHANCGHCHNPHSHVFTDNGVTMVLRESVGNLGTVGQTNPYQTAVNKAAGIVVPQAEPTNCTNGLGTPVPCIITHGKPDESVLIYRFETMNVNFHMPALASKIMDPTGDAALRDWITNIP